MDEIPYALSLKQPWATLLVRGLKSIEVRRWPTRRSGRILIHAARVADSRPLVWRHLPPELHAEAKTMGGIIGSAELVECRRYPTLEDFARDQVMHLNELEWFEPPALYGFRFVDPEPRPFYRYPGWFKFFRVSEALK